MEPASYAPAADCVRHLVYHSHDDDEFDIHLTLSCFSLSFDDCPARRQPSPLAVSPDHFIHHFLIAIITILVTVAKNRASPKESPAGVACEAPVVTASLP